MLKPVGIIDYARNGRISCKWPKNLSSTGIQVKKQINQTMAGVGGSNLASTFNRMEEKIKQMHDEADAAHELANSDKSLDEKFEETFKATKNVAVEDELAALKAELEGNK